MPQFQLTAKFTPAGDQPKAIDALVRGLEEGKRNQVLLGVTGSGKMFAMADFAASRSCMAAECTPTHGSNPVVSASL